jgi:hypothetical protein
MTKIQHTQAPIQMEKSPNVIEIYSLGCVIGMTTGSKIGAYIGGLVGFGIPASAPFVLSYGLLKAGRQLLRK